jgi:phosphoribosyl 1,2-cyclic phosphodiesterase
MITFSLQSGSNGNAIYVEAGDVRLLIDAGISGKLAQGRMRVHGRDISGVDALLISHDHVDHIRCAGVLHRKFKFPIYMTRKTQDATTCDLGELTDVRYFSAGERLWLKGVVVHTIRTPHDAADGVAFIIEHDGKRLGILTDLGRPFEELSARLPTLDAAYIESNYDPHMLENGPYPAHLQQRIRGGRGHLSNGQAAELVRSASKKLKWAALAHLSQENNHPEVAMDAHRRCVGGGFPLHIASRHDVGPVLTV